MIAATCGGVPRGRQYLRAERARRRLAVLRGQAALVRAARGAGSTRAPTGEPLLLGGDFNIAPTDADVWDPTRVPRRHPRLGRRSAPRSRRLLDWGLVDAYRALQPEPERYTWWDYRAGNFHKNYGMRIDHLLVDAAGRRARRAGPRSIAKRARASRSRRTTRRWWSTSTSRAGRSTPAGPKPVSGSPPAPASDRADRWPPTTTTSFTTWRLVSTPEEIAEVLGDGPDLARWWPSVYLDVEQLEPGGPDGVGAVVGLYTKGWLPYRSAGAFGSPRTAAAHGFSLEAIGGFVGRGIWTFEQVGDERSRPTTGRSRPRRACSRTFSVRHEADLRGEPSLGDGPGREVAPPGDRPAQGDDA